MTDAQDAVASNPQSKRFQLTHVLRAHSSDVRWVATTLDHLSGREALLSGSRDETATYWSRAFPSAEHAAQPATSFDRGATFHGKRFCNAVAFVQPSPLSGLPRGQILMGNLDSQIRCFDPLRADRPLQVLSDHFDNISVLEPCHNLQPNQRHVSTSPVFISGSWDKTARVWTWDAAHARRRWSTKFVLRGHDEAVWGVQIVEPPSCESTQHSPPTFGAGRYLTSSADLFIRLFHGEQLHAVYAGHTDVVRSLRLLPTLSASSDDAETSSSEDETPALYPKEALFASASNDGTVRVWSLDPRRSPTPGNGGAALRVLKAHTSLVYDIATYVERGSKAQRLVSSGEDGTFRVWDWASGELIQTVWVPVVSVWSIAVLPRSQDVIVGCSDSLVRVYSLVAPSSTALPDSNFGGGLLSECEAAAEAETAQKVQQQHTLAIQAKQNASTPGEQSSVAGDGQVFEGTRYDFVLRVDVSDDAEPLRLPMNRGDDAKQAASDFVAVHNLPESYVERIVEFMNLVLS